MIKKIAAQIVGKIQSAFGGASQVPIHVYYQAALGTANNAMHGSTIKTWYDICVEIQSIIKYEDELQGNHEDYYHPMPDGDLARQAELFLIRTGWKFSIVNNEVVDCIKEEPPPVQKSFWEKSSFDVPAVSPEVDAELVALLVENLESVISRLEGVLQEQKNKE